VPPAPSDQSFRGADIEDAGLVGDREDHARAAAQRFIDNNPIYVWYLIGDFDDGLPKPASLQ
jgi:hypothetical protein